MMTNMRARPRERCARIALSVLENRQTGGGCVGGLLTCPRNAPLTKDGGAASTSCGGKTAAGKIAATKLKHLSAHATAPLQSSEVQQGMSTCSDTDISTGFVETATPPLAGTTATERAIRAARIVRTTTMPQTIRRYGSGVNHHPMTARKTKGPREARGLFFCDVFVDD
jgi:hypothetical protein